VRNLIFKLKIFGLDIKPFIRELILLNECVILRGVGGFETKYKHASFKENGKAITPPSKQIHFRPELLVDNGVLEKHISDSTGLNRSKASDEIDNFVQEFYNEIRQSKKIILKGIGEFSMDENSKLHFRELDDEIYLADSFGLEILDIEGKPKVTKTDQKPELTPVIPQKRRLTGWYITIGILLLVISVTFIILISEESGRGIFNTQKGKAGTTKSHVIIFGPQQTKKPDSLQRAIEKTIDNKTSIRNALAIDTLKKPAAQNRVVAKQASGFSYYLIAGSFRNKRNADIMTEQLIREGFNSEIMATNDGYFRVVIGKFNERQAAIDELRRIRKLIEQSVWLWEVN
jgi:nucleoid DNA-binding protein